MSVINKCCHCGSTSDPPSSPSDSSPSESSPSASSPSASSSLSDSLSSSSSSLSSSSDSMPGFEFCMCDCCLWPNTFILTVSDIQFLNNAGFGGTQPQILNYPTSYTLDRQNGLTWASRESVFDVADDISDGGFDFPTNIFGLGRDGTIGGQTTPGSRFVTTANGGSTIRDRQAFVRFIPIGQQGACNFVFSLFGVGQALLFSQSICFPGGTTNPNTFLPLQPGPHSWTCMGGATFGSFVPKITSVSPFRSTCRLPAVWWLPFGVGAEQPSASLTPA